MVLLYYSAYVTVMKIKINWINETVAYTFKIAVVTG